MRVGNCTGRDGGDWFNILSNCDPGEQQQAKFKLPKAGKGSIFVKHYPPPPPACTSDLRPLPNSQMAIEVSPDMNRRHILKP